MNYSHITKILLLFFVLGCNRFYVKSIFPIPSKKLFRTANQYKTEYGHIALWTDTAIAESNVQRSYSRGALKKIGRIKDGIPTGYWFLYNDSLELEYILKYNTDRIDSFYHPFAIIQQSW